MKCRTLIALAAVLIVSPLMAQDKERMLFTFDKAEAAEQWQTVNDGVMGGRSDGRFRMTDDNTMDFYGTLSLENNGGFASVRSRGTKLGLEKGDALVARVRGDGRQYSLNLYTPKRRIAFSYRARFKTKKDEWIEIHVPLDKFVATSFGRVVRNQPLDPTQLNGLGILLGDKQAGPFKLEIDWIKVSVGSLFANEMLIQRDIAYAESKHERQTLDVYAPTSGKRHPIIVWIHGGGWRQGDKANVQHKPQAFVDKGFVFASVNYRFVPDVNLKEQTADIAKAIKWVRDHADDYGGDPDTFFVAGHSAGAHLAALVCTDNEYLKAQGLPLTIIKGCIPVDTAAYDVPRRIRLSILRGKRFLIGVFGEDEQQQKAFSPITHVAKDKNIPPFLILHVAVRPGAAVQSEAFAKALRASGMDATVVAAEDKNHATINRELGLPDDLPTKALFDFLDGVMKPN